MEQLSYIAVGLPTRLGRPAHDFTGFIVIQYDFKQDLWFRVSG